MIRLPFISRQQGEELGMVATWNERLLTERTQFAGLGVAGLLSLVVVGVAVAMAAAESRDDVAALAAVGAGLARHALRAAADAAHGVVKGADRDQSLVPVLTGLDVGSNHLPGGKD